MKWENALDWDTRGTLTPSGEQGEGSPKTVTAAFSRFAEVADRDEVKLKQLECVQDFALILSELSGR